MNGRTTSSHPSEQSEVLRRHQSLDRHRQRLHVDSPTGLADCWCISLGMAGMNSQTSGLAQAVGVRFEFKDIALKFPWNCLPMSWVPWSSGVLSNADCLSGDPPRLIISCGRHGIIPSLYLKRRYGSRVCNVHIQDPHMDTSGFDLVVVPRHDDLRGSNVCLTTGALHYVTGERLAEARESSEAAPFRTGRQPLVVVLLGGKNGYYGFSRSDMERLAAKLHRLSHAHDVRLAILPSRRTPDHAVQLFREEFSDRHFVWDRVASNPYFAALAWADYIVVTGDSVSMVSEATATARPVFIEHLTERRHARRFRKFHHIFHDAGYTRPFEGFLSDWTYEPPNDTARIAQLIRERIATI